MDFFNEELDLKYLRHTVVILMVPTDGQKRRNMPRTYGHKVQGSQVVEDMLNGC